MPGTAVDPAALYRAHRARVDIVDVPELGFVVVAGEGDPSGSAFAEAAEALYAVTYGAHLAVKKQVGTAPKVMPLEALWWVDEPRLEDLLLAVVMDAASPADIDRDRWQWQAMIMLPAPIDERTVTEALDRVRKKDLAALDLVRYVRWREGRCAQLLHVGPYANEGPDIVKLHNAIDAAGYRPTGRHHEIYLGDPRRSARRLRTLLRHPVERD